MACGCNKRAASQSESPAARRAREDREAEARKGAPRPTAQSAPVMHGATQSFALEAGGRTQAYGSRLERDAAVARTPSARAV